VTENENTDESEFDPPAFEVSQLVYLPPMLDLSRDSTPFLILDP